MPPGLQAAQAVHAALEYSVKHPETISRWAASSNYLVIVAVPDEASLVRLTQRAHEASLEHHLVHEPDVDNEATALALEPGEKARRLCASLPLALRDLTPREAAMSPAA